MHPVYCSSIIIWAATETGVTIIAVSIPYLRTLVRGWRSTQYYGGASSGEQKSNGYQLDDKPKYNHHRSSRFGNSGKRSNHWADNEKDLERTVNGGGDDGSDRSILHEERGWVTLDGGKGGFVRGFGTEGEVRPGAIKKTNEVTITYGRRQGGEDVASPGPRSGPSAGFGLGTAL